MKGKLDLSTRVFALVVVFIVGLFAYWGFRVFEIWNVLDGDVPPKTITVEATGKAFSAPDVAYISLGVNTRAQSSEEAVIENTNKINTIIEKLSKSGVEKKDIQTANYYLSPYYNWMEEQGQFQDGYVLDQNLNVRVRDFEKLGEVISASASVGANMIGSINFEIEDTEKAKTEARESAIASAKVKASLIAKSVGLRLGNVVNYYEYESFDYGYAKGLGGFAVDESVAFDMVSPQIEPGQEQVELIVSLTYRIK